MYALVLHLFVLNTFILIQFIHLNASISSVIVYLYTSSILYTYALVCIYLFKPAQFHALGAHIYASSGQLQLPQIHTYGGIMGHHLHLYTYGESYTIMHVYTYTLIHVYTYAASYTMQQIETSTQPCAMDIVHVIHACATTRYHRFALMELLCMC